MKWLIKLAVVVGVCVLAFRLWWGPTYEYRYRLTMTVETPQGPKSVSGVLGVTSTPGPDSLSILNSGGGAPKIKGEALFLDMGEGKNLIMLLTHGPTGASVDTFGEMPLWALEVARFV
jgi:hypothetical protein